MHASGYIGRVGGLAVALGVGTAIFTGAGVAHATEGDDSGTGAPASQEQGGGGTTTAVKDTDSGGVVKIDLKPPRLSDIIGRHRADDTTPNSNTATSIVKRLSDAAKRVTDAIENAADADNTVVRSTMNTGGSSLQDRIAARTERVGAQTSSPDTLTEGGAAQKNNVVANQFASNAAVVKDWISSPRALAGRSVDTTPTVPAPTSLWTPPQILAPLGTMKAAPGAGATAVRTTLLTTVLGVVNPFAGNTPGSPAGVDPLSLVVAGAARREIGVESFTPTALLAPSTNSLTYNPTTTLVHGVIGGTNTPTAGVQYLVVSQPSGGGKVFVDPTTGNFTFLPDLSTVQDDGTETFRVVAAETTPFTTALTGIPLVGGLVDQVLVVLYQVPVVNVLLAPIIGKSEITSVSVDLTEVPDYESGDPIAFTVMVPSDDGVMISTNYFPAWSVADGTATAAPTILNGPGLATAGNIDPNAPNTVDGLVPGIDELTKAGYNVITWDPRGEFDSTGTLELDSPEFEGQDVKNIITWVSDNSQYTHQAMESANDPWIGMVGGSYGGGIQLVSAAIDDRVDVIVPGIAWNNLNDSLYTNDAFKTSYASLLLLGLVTTGSRINPQIYGGIITGAVLGILLPSQQDLLERSGPWDIVGGIDVPTMFVQGTVDVLFPLQQALNNAVGMPTNQANIRMIWFCGGHGACLTLTPDQLEQQDQFLADNTIAFLNNALPEADGTPNDVVTIPKFQFVDQDGKWYTADFLPVDVTNPAVDDFYTDSTPIVTQGNGGLLAIVPVLGGSGPQSLAGFPASLGLGSQATNAINVPLDDAAVGTQVVGAPQLTMTYSGIGTSRHVYAQVVDKKTGLVVGNIVTPLPVTLDGRTHTQTYSMEDIVWTYGDSVPDASDLELQIVGSATPYLNFTEYGYINVNDVTVSMPTPGPGVVHDLEEEDTLAVSA